MENAKRLTLALLFVASSAAAAPPIVSAKSWLNSKALTDADLQTRVVLLDFWASWCIPCLRNLPKVQSYADALKDKPFTVIGVHYEDAPPDFVALYLRDQGIRFPIAIDTGETYKRFNVPHFPRYVLIDKTGAVQWVGDEPPSMAAITVLLNE